MNWQDIDISSGGATLSMWPPVIYYFVSIIVGGGLYFGRLFVEKYANITVFFIYGFFVLLIAAIHYCLFRFGAEFASDILRVHLDVYAYDSIFWGSFCFALLYCIAVPTKFK
ncbi:hypothetical protein [Mangrovibacter phragmitis]|uniref:hypothetical protein n=1 Tax=Mangrovibacter phragmitis TaxID=1691903 RepID=UPI003514792B